MRKTRKFRYLVLGMVVTLMLSMTVIPVHAATCIICHGTGRITCNICHGTGRTTTFNVVPSSMEENSPCPGCSARGFNPCTVCGGTGQVPDDNTNRGGGGTTTPANNTPAAGNPSAQTTLTATAPVVGEITQAADFHKVWDFFEGMAAVSRNGQVGFIDESCKLVIPLEYKMGTDGYNEGMPYGQFYKGVAKMRVSFDPGKHKAEDGYIFNESVTSAALIDKRGNLVVPPEFSKFTITSISTDGSSVLVSKFDKSDQYHTAWYGVYDMKGNIIVPFKAGYDHVQAKIDAGTVQGKWGEEPYPTKGTPVVFPQSQAGTVPSSASEVKTPDIVTTSGTASTTDQIQSFDIYGSTSGNISNGGSLLQIGPSRYYYAINRELFIAENGTTTKITDDLSLFPGLNQAGYWIYYQGTEGICKINVDGTRKTILDSTANARYLIYANGWLYYNDNNAGRVIKRMQTDGTEKQIINNEASYDIFVKGDWIYYRNYNADTDKRNICKIRTDGTQRTVIHAGNSCYLIFDDDYVYYSDFDDGKALYKMKLDGTGVTKLIDAEIYGINTTDDKVIFSGHMIKSDGSVDRGIYSLNKDGTKLKKEANDAPSDVYAFKNMIYYEKDSKMVAVAIQ